MFQRNKKEFLGKYVTMDETWIHHFTPKSNRQSAERTAAGEIYPKRLRRRKKNVNSKSVVFKPVVDLEKMSTT